MTMTNALPKTAESVADLVAQPEVETITKPPLKLYRVKPKVSTQKNLVQVPVEKATMSSIVWAAFDRSAEIHASGVVAHM